MISQQKICIPAVGLSSVLGGADQASAAFCAGIKLPQKSMTFELHDNDEELPQPLSIMGLPKSAFAYSGVARFSVNLAEAILDLLGQYVFDSRTPFILMLPDPNARGLEGDWEGEAALEKRVNLFGEKIIEATNRILAARAPDLDCHFYYADHTGIAKALNYYQHKVQQLNWNTCLIGAVDSLVNNDTLELLLNEGKFKCDDQPVGFVPAESAGVFVVSSSCSSGLFVDCVIETGDLAYNEELNLIPSSCHFTSINTPRDKVRHSLLISDINGEPFRSYEWGNLLLKLNKNNFSDDSTDIFYPVETFGESGVGTGFVSWLIALYCLKREIFSAIENVILSLSDGEKKERALIFLTRTH